MSDADVLIGFVLDRSASMSPVINDTVRGFNEFIDSQKDDEGEALLSLTLFNSELEVRYVAQRLADIPPMTAFEGPNAYSTGSNTGLFDAVGVTVKGIEQWVANHPQFTGHVKMVILTDGQENASHVWHINAGGVKDGDDHDLLGLIQWKQKEGWEFIFLGAGGSEWLEHTFSSVVDQSAFFAYQNDAGGSADAYAAVGAAMKESRSKGVPMAAPLAADPRNKRPKR
jgi:hypothetical protein